MDTTSLIDYTNSIRLIVMVDTCEYRDVAMVDIPSAYLYATIDEFILLKIVDK